jgi:HEPN domain-containing protein
MREEAKRWLASAAEDLRKAKDTFGLSHYDLSSFLCQQTAEKALKAGILDKKKKLIKTHDLVILGKEMGAGKREMDICKSLGPIYTETRYPDATGSFRQFSKDQSEEDLRSAEHILTWTRKKLS